MIGGVAGGATSTCTSERYGLSLPTVLALTRAELCLGQAGRFDRVARELPRLARFHCMPRPVRLFQPHSTRSVMTLAPGSSWFRHQGALVVVVFTGLAAGGWHCRCGYRPRLATSTTRVLW